MRAADLVAYVAVGLSIVCFISFCIQSFYEETAKSAPKNKVNTAVGLLSDKSHGLAVPSVPEFTDLLKAFSQVMDSFSKAGPKLTMIGASVLFLLIAALASGCFQGAPSKQETSQESSK